MVLFESLKRGFHCFVDGTSMHGFRELYYAKDLFWNVCWSAVIASALAITLLQGYRATYQFAYQPSTITLNQINPDDMVLPPIRICHVHWMYWVDWKKGYSLNFTKESMLYGLSYMTDIYSSTYFEKDKAKEDFLNSMILNNFSFLSQFYVAIAKPLALVEKESGFPLLNDNRFFNTVEIVFKNRETILCYTSTPDIVLAELSGKKHQLLSPGLDNDFIFSIQDPTYELLSDELSSEEYNYYVATWLKYFSVYWIDFNDTLLDYASFVLPTYFFPDGYAEKFVLLNRERLSYRVVLDVSIHTWKNTAANPCEENEKRVISGLMCHDICHAQYFAQTCKCPTVAQNALIGKDTIENLCPGTIFFLPFRQSINDSTEGNESNIFYRMADNTTVINFMSSYDHECEENAESRKIFYECLTHCLQPCESWSYTVSSSSYKMESSVAKRLYKNQTDIYVQFSNPENIYIVAEIDAISFEVFVGNIGGLLGVWTGASVISFFQLCYLCICEKSTPKNRKRKHGRAQNSALALSVSSKQTQTEY